MKTKNINITYLKNNRMIAQSSRKSSQVFKSTDDRIICINQTCNLSIVFRQYKN